MEIFSLNFLQRINKEDCPITDDIILRNYFIVNFPEEMGVRYYDVISVNFLEDNICRFTIRNNHETLPLYNLFNYKCKKCGIINFFRRKKDEIHILQLKKEDMSIIYDNVLTNICVKKIYEEELTYKDGKPQEIIVDIKYKKRFLFNHATDKERE